MNFLHDLVCIYEDPTPSSPIRFTIGHLTNQYMTQLWFSSLDEAIDMVTSGDVNEYTPTPRTSRHELYSMYLKGMIPHTYILDGQVISYDELASDYPEYLT